MAKAESGSEFLGLLKSSQLLSDDLFKKLEKSVSGIGTAGDSARRLAATLVKSGIVTAWQAKRLLSGKHTGFYVGKYKLLEVLGAGGMGHVYLAEQITMQRLVAMKLIRADTNKKHRKEIVARFTREARAVAALSHPNIVQAFDFDEEDGIPYMVMEFMEGIDAARQFDKFGKIPWAQASDYVAQAAAGLGHAHEAGLVHRDVKPGNMHVDRDGRVRILDLGLVSVMEGTQDDSLTVEQHQLGSVDYIAPEQALNSHQVDARADIYGLGAAFYVVISGKLLFEGTSTAQKLLAQQTQEPQPIAELVPDIPADLAAVITKMVAKNPDDRFQTTAEVVAAVQPFAKRISPPYDFSAIRHTHEAIKPYMRRSPDATELNREQSGAARELAGDGKKNKTTGSSSRLSTQDSFLNDAGSDFFDLSNEDFGTPKPRRKSGGSRSSTRKKQPAKAARPARSSSRSTRLGKKPARKKKQTNNATSLPLLLGVMVALLGLAWFVLFSGGDQPVRPKLASNQPAPDVTVKKVRAKTKRTRNPRAGDRGDTNNSTQNVPFNPGVNGKVLIREDFESSGNSISKWRVVAEAGSAAEVLAAADGHFIRLRNSKAQSSLNVMWDLGKGRGFEPFRLQFDWRPLSTEIFGRIINLGVNDRNTYVFRLRRTKNNDFEIPDGKSHRSIKANFEKNVWYRFNVDCLPLQKEKREYHFRVTHRGANNQDADARVIYDSANESAPTPRLDKSTMRFLSCYRFVKKGGTGYESDLDNVSFSIIK